MGGVGWMARRITNSPRALLGSYLALLAASAVLYHAFEDGVDGKGVSIGDALWWVVVTSSTVGYGDTYPSTWQGRVLAGLLISVMVFLVIPLITAHFASRLIVDNDAFKHEEQEEIKAQLRAIRELTERLATDAHPCVHCREADQAAVSTATRSG